jgi:hypothetical protein
LLGLSAGSLVYGVVEGNDGAIVIGGVGLAFVVLAYGVARVIGRPRDSDDGPDV